MEQFDSRYFSGQGKVFAGDRDAAGEPVNLRFIGDMNEVNLSPNVERTNIRENVTGARGISASFINQSQFDLTIAMRSVKPAHVAFALHGTSTDVAGASATDERHDAYLGDFVALDNLGVSTVVVTQDPDGVATVLTEDTDYKVHAEHGLIEILEGGSVVDGEELGFDYDFVAQSRVDVEPHNVAKYLLFGGLNRADDDRNVRCDIWKTKIDPGVLGWISQEEQNISLSGTVLIDMLRPAGERFYRWIQDESI